MLEQWHLDKRVPLSIIGAIMLQTCTIVWWAAGIDARLNDHETRLTKEETFVSKHVDEGRDVYERIVRLEERFQNQERILTTQANTLLRIEELIRDSGRRR